MKPNLDAELMQHADGELDEASARELDERIGRDGAARGKLDAIGELGELVRGHIELSTDAVPDARFAGLWREIDKRLEHEREPERVAVPAAPDGVWRRLARWFDHYRGHIITGAVSAGAVAALALVLRGPSSDPGSSSPGHGPINVAPVVFRPSEIESLDTPGGTGTVFNLQDEDGSTTVIWVTPEDTVEGI
jgi:hypothetical protein